MFYRIAASFLRLLFPWLPGHNSHRTLTLLLPFLFPFSSPSNFGVPKGLSPSFPSVHFIHIQDLCHLSLGTPHIYSSSLYLAENLHSISNSLLNIPTLMTHGTCVIKLNLALHRAEWNKMCSSVSNFNCWHCDPLLSSRQKPGKSTGYRICKAQCKTKLSIWGPWFKS